MGKKEKRRLGVNWGRIPSEKAARLGKKGMQEKSKLVVIRNRRDRRRLYSAKRSPRASGGTIKRGRFTGAQKRPLGAAEKKRIACESQDRRHRLNTHELSVRCPGSKVGNTSARGLFFQRKSCRARNGEGAAAIGKGDLIKMFHNQKKKIKQNNKTKKQKKTN